jgi:hypothetical protein
MLFNWGHTWEHIGDRGRAELAYHAVIRYLPSHVRAHGALAEAQRVGRSTALRANERTPMTRSASACWEPAGTQRDGGPSPASE